MTYSFRLSFLLILCCACHLFAQSKTSVPTLTTDDLPSAPLPASHKNTDLGKVLPPKTTEKNSAPALQPPTASASEAEKSWNAQVKQAQEKVTGLERRADQTEMDVNRLRNFLQSAESRAPETNGQVVAKIDELVNLTNQLRFAAQVARKDLETVLREGLAQGFSVSAPKLTDEKGERDPAAYKKEQGALESALQDARTRLELLQVRLNSVQAESLRKGNGDNFALNRLKEERENINQEIEKTRDRISELSEKLQHLQKD